MEISCHCGATSQTAQASASSVTGLILCHCDTCRHMTGLLCTSYVPIREPDSLSGTRSYSWGGSSTAWFCATCGCHVFRSTRTGVPAEERWEVASGVVVGALKKDDSDSEHERQVRDVESWPALEEHLGVADTGDGGISVWLGQIAGRQVKSMEGDRGSDSAAASGGNVGLALAHTEPKWTAPVSKSDSNSSQGSAQEEIEAVRELQASCHCRGVRFHLTRPDASSRDPFSGFPDLMIPYITKNPQIKNPDDVKWWLRQDATKFLAGTCACRSCRLVSGFEIQPWTFIPESNIIFHISSAAGAERTVSEKVLLDFDKLHAAGILQAYESSAGVVREFCPHCGATVFWHDKWRPQLIDTSVGLLCARDGAMALSWLDWWKERVSFVEDAELDRHGSAAQWATALVSALERNMREVA
jgi:hypothetical protein